MLAIDRCMHLAAEEVFEGDNLHFCETRLIFDPLADPASFDGVHRAAGDRRGFDLDCGLAPPHLDACIAAATASYSLCPDALDAFDLPSDPVEGLVDFGQARDPRFERKVGQVDIDRETREISVEEIDGGSTLQGENWFVGNHRQSLNEELELENILFTGHRCPRASREDTLPEW